MQAAGSTGKPWHVINTRPLARGQHLTRTLRAQAYQVTDLPLLELIAEPLTHRLREQLGHMPAARVVIVVSPTAASVGLAYLHQLNLAPTQLACHWIAVGSATATVLQQAGLQPSAPALETSEGMLRLPALQQLAPSSLIMFWRGQGGREFMMQVLQQHHRIVSLLLYRRQLPAFAIAQYRSLPDTLAHVLLISSGVSWQHWLLLAKQTGRIIYPAYIVVLGERIFQLIAGWLSQQHGPGQLVCRPQLIRVTDLQPDTLLDVLKKLPKCEQT